MTGSNNIIDPSFLKKEQKKSLETNFVLNWLV
jgi:hypothetical protein